MKKVLISVFILITIASGKLFSQAVADSLLFGSWQLTSEYKQGDTPRISGYSYNNLSYISFYRNHVYQDKIYYKVVYYTDKKSGDTIHIDFTGPDSIYRKRIKDTFYIDAGRWQLDAPEKTIKINDYHSVKSYSHFIVRHDDRDLKILSFHDSTLVLVFNTELGKMYRKYKKVSALPPITDNYKSYPRYDIYLVNSCDTTRRIRLRDWQNCEINLGADMRTYESWYDNLQGSIDSLSNKNLYFTVVAENIEATLKNGYRYKNEFDYMAYYDSTKPKDSLMYKNMHRAINLDAINYFSYQSKTRETVNLAGGALLYLSAATAILAAPLLSIDYKNGGFNSNRYFTLAGAGLGGICLSIPIMLFGQGKYYYLTTRNNLSAGNLWYLSKQMTK
jgi:hypothetical protein